MPVPRQSVRSTDARSVAPKRLMGLCRIAVVLVALTAGVPCGAFAQAIAGAVQDQSGVPLAGVTVRAASSALIEKTRTSVTDPSGQYRIEALRPGTYSITFTRSGFGPFVRDGVQVTGAFTATVNAQLAPGGLTETITVTAAAPAIDVRGAAAATTLDDDTV